MSLEQDASGKCYPKNMVLVQHVTDDSRNGIKKVFSKRHVKLLKINDKEMGINWNWLLSIDSISIKSPLGGRKQEIVLLIEVNWAQKDIF